MSLTEAIHLGLRRGYYQNRRFKNELEGFDNKMVEYLLTVFVAIELSNFAGYNCNTRLQLEYPMWQFFNDAFPASHWRGGEDIFSPSEFVQRSYEKKRTKERIDIVIQKEDQGLKYKSLHGIELKAINKNYESVIADINRLSNSMINTDPISANSIIACYSGFLVSHYDKTIADEAILARRKTKVENDIRQLIDSRFATNQEFSILNYNIVTQSIDEESSEAYLEKYSGYPELLDYDDAVRATGQVLGVVVEITRR